MIAASVYHKDGSKILVISGRYRFLTYSLRYGIRIPIRKIFLVSLLFLFDFFMWCGGVVVIRSPHDPEVPSSNPGKNNTSDFSIRDPLSLPSCDWYRIYLAIWWNSSVGRAADLIYTCQVRCHGFDSRCFPHI